jgi:hypothetical protein
VFLVASAGQFVCARVGNQQRCGVVIERLRSSVRSLLHHRRDPHQSTYLNLTEDQELTSHQVLGSNPQLSATVLQLLHIFLE